MPEVARLVPPQVSACCGAAVVEGLLPFGEPRCTGCAHRQPVTFWFMLGEHATTVTVPPPGTRHYPPWVWPLELLGRAAARRMGRRLRSERTHKALARM